MPAPAPATTPERPLAREWETYRTELGAVGAIDPDAEELLRRTFYCGSLGTAMIHSRAAKLSRAEGTKLVRSLIAELREYLDSIPDVKEEEECLHIPNTSTSNMKQNGATNTCRKCHK